MGDRDVIAASATSALEELQASEMKPLEALQQRSVADEAAEILDGDADREHLAREVAVLRGGMAAYRETAVMLADTLAAVAPAVTAFQTSVIALDRAVEARKAAVALRVDEGYGAAVSEIASGARKKRPSCSRASIVREIRSLEAAGKLPGVSLPANDRTIETRLRSLGY